MFLAKYAGMILVKKPLVDTTLSVDRYRFCAGPVLRPLRPDRLIPSSDRYGQALLVHLLPGGSATPEDVRFGVVFVIVFPARTYYSKTRREENIVTATYR